MSSSNNIRSFCIVGLGNPGKKFENTRHNIGFSLVDFFVRNRNLQWVDKKNYSISRGLGNVLYLKPMQYMNLSGYSVKEITSFYKIPAENILVCYDDFTFEVGDFRLKPQGSSGGQNGLNSIIEQMGTQKIPRLRIGIKPLEKKNQDIKDLVLSPFSQEEISIYKEIFPICQNVVSSFINDGINKAMNLANTKI